MTKIATATFKARSWDENQLEGVDNLPKRTKCHCQQDYSGDIEGESALEYLMAYDNQGNATFVGIEQVVGSVHGKQGSFVLQHVGVFENGIAKIDLNIVPGTATGDLTGMEGSCRFESPHADHYEIHLEYELPGNG